MPKYRIRYGCYLDGHDSENDYPLEIIEASSEGEANNIAYDIGYEHVSEWYGMHGFGVDAEDYEDEDEFFEQMNEDINNALDYWVEEITGDTEK